MPAALTLPPAVLLVDDEPYFRQLVMSLLLTYLPADMIVSASDGRHALQYIDTCAISLLITGQQMPNLTGLDLIDIVKARYPDIRIILMSGDLQQDAEQCGHEHGADFVLAKPLRVGELISILDRVLPARNERAVAAP